MLVGDRRRRGKSAENRKVPKVQVKCCVLVCRWREILYTHMRHAAFISAYVHIYIIHDRHIRRRI